MGTRTGHWADLAAELCGAIALSCGFGVSAWLAAPLAALPPTGLAAAGAALGGLAGWAIVRAAPGAVVPRAMPEFQIAQVTDLVGNEPLTGTVLLDNPIEQAELSRVVQLFDPPAADTPGVLQARIAAHLGGLGRAMALAEGESPAPWNGSPAIPDASDALHAALAEIRRSLRAS